MRSLPITSRKTLANMKYLFFDIETTGIPGKDQDWETDFENFPRIVQIAWQIYEESEGQLKLVEKFSRIFKPEGWLIPDKVADIHGISTAKACAEGFNETLILDLFLNTALKCDRIIGHNVYFDASITKANMLRLGFDKMVVHESLHKDKRDDTMRMAMQLYKGQTGNKFYRLGELYEKLFGKQFDFAHTADADVNACAECYFEIIKRMPAPTSEAV